MEKRSSITYEQAGVNIAKGNELVNIIKKMAKLTQRKGIYSEIGGFGGLFDLQELAYNDPILVSTTDGVGTKLKVAIEASIHNTIGIDLVAMCVNDLVVQAAEPLFFLDYFAIGRLDIEIAEQIMQGIVQGCKMANCALLGGETAEMPGMYNDQDYDLAGFSVGVVERSKLLPKKDELKEGDIILGIASSGIHSNGFSLIRNIMKKYDLKYRDKSSFSNKSFAEELLKPTIIYVNTCLAAINKGCIKALAHITGGGLIENIPRVMRDNLVAVIDKNSWKLPEVFSWIQELAMIENYELFKTFNCGIGMVAITAPENEQDMMEIAKKNGHQIFKIGEIKSRTHSSEPAVIIN